MENEKLTISEKLFESIELLSKSFNFNNILLGIVFVIGSFVLYTFFKKFINQANRKGRLNDHQASMFVQFGKYLIYVLLFYFLLSIFQVEFKYLLAFSPLLVGVGLGLQQIFNDMSSGVILSIENNIKVNDVVEVDGMVAKVIMIGLRTSKIETRDGIIIIIPNHILVSGKLINWSANKPLTRFYIKIGVAYGSDLELVRKILINCAKKHSKVVSNPMPLVILKDYGDSSIDLELMFWSQHLFIIEKIKSDIRYQINEQFNANNVMIPFPQQDIYIKSINQNEKKS
jgi:small-conductance mechanosensitive channel